VAKADASSILHLYRRLLAGRRASPALGLGTFSWLPSPEGVLSWLRQHGDDRRVVIVNFTDATVVTAIEGAWIVSTASDGPSGEGAPFSGGVGACQGLVLRPG
jgi:alpha-glucosidase